MLISYLLHSQDTTFQLMYNSAVLCSVYGENKSRFDIDNGNAKYLLLHQQVARYDSHSSKTKDNPCNQNLI